MLNIAARIITQIYPTNHIPLILKELHRLPVENQIEYQVVLFTFKALGGLALQYIAQLLKPKPTHRPLRFSNADILKVSRTRTKNFGDQAFSCAAPMLQNTLPDNLKNYQLKKQLKRTCVKDLYG